MFRLQPRKFTSFTKFQNRFVQTIAIRREDGVLWERRAPFTPEQVSQIIKTTPDIKFLVQPSNQRIFSMDQYIKAGAVESDNISSADVIIGVKQVPIDQLIPKKTYVFFSHTIKAQEAQMSLLDACLDKEIRLIDYEKIQEDGSGKRLVAFGKWAGVVGALDILNALGMRLLALGYNNPFLQIARSHNYASVDECYELLRTKVKPELSSLRYKLDEPLTIVFTGNGNVSNGAQEVFKELGIEMVDPSDLALIKRDGDKGKLYGSIVHAGSHLTNKDPTKAKYFSLSHFQENPEEYESNFATKIAPYMNVLINGMVWMPGQPKLLTNEDLKPLNKLYAVSDISADPNGSLEFMQKNTSLDNPYMFFNTDTLKHSPNFIDSPGFIYCSVDNMPTQVAKEATRWFGDGLMPLVPSLLQASNTSKSYPQLINDKLSPEISQAMITSDGSLTPRFEYITPLRKSLSRSRKTDLTKKNVLVLGAGMVSGPLVRYLDSYSIRQTLASFHQQDGVDLINLCKTNCASAVQLDVASDRQKLHDLVDSHDIVISLVPYTLHHHVVQAAVETKTNMITASYLSPILAEMDKAVRDAGIFVLNEIGLDPGIDHMLAMECFDSLKSKNGRDDNNIKSFISFCGGLPAPEASNNALRYKFSWSPRGVLMAAMNPAIYLKDNERIEVPQGGEILKSRIPVDFHPGFNLEAIPNRDSMAYKEPYGLHSIETMLRGTLRFAPFCDVVYGLKSTGLCEMENQVPENCNSWNEIMTALNFKEKLEASPKNHDSMDIVLRAMNDLGLFSKAPLSEKVKSAENILDAFANHLAETLVYNLHEDSKERDLVALRHEIIEHGADEKHVIDFVHYGDEDPEDGWSAMAKTVSLPVAISARFALEGKMDEKRGMLRPLEKDVYQPILAELRRLGLHSMYTVEKLHDPTKEDDSICSRD